MGRQKTRQQKGPRASGKMPFVAALPITPKGHPISHIIEIEPSQWLHPKRDRRMVLKAPQALEALMSPAA